MTLYFVLYVCAINYVIAFDYYGGTTGPISKQFEVTLTNNGKTVYPHVYGINAPSQAKEPHVNNWIEFEQDDSEKTTISVTRLDQAFPSNVEIRPIRYGISLKLSNNDKTVTFDVKGNAKHISVHYGSDIDNDDTNSAIYSSMLIFVTPPNIDQLYLENIKKSPNTKVFKAGTKYKLKDGDYAAGQGVYSVNDTVNSKINTIILERGAYVYGKLDVNMDNVNIYGPGILDGSNFNYDNRKTGDWNERLMMVNVYGKNVHVVGLTIVTPSFRFFDKIRLTIQYFRGIGWLPNNGQGRLAAGAQELDSFIRTYDDMLKLDEGVVTKNLVIWQGKHGGSFQFGWFDRISIQKEVHNINWDIIATEYYQPQEWEGTNTKSNAATISSVYLSNTELTGPFNFYNFNVDCVCRHFFLLSMDKNGILKNLNFYDVNIRKYMYGFNAMWTKDDSSKISDIHFHNLQIGGKVITSLNDAKLKFEYTGNVDLKSITFSTDSTDTTSSNTLKITNAKGLSEWNYIVTLENIPSSGIYFIRMRGNGQTSWAEGIEDGKNTYKFTEYAPYEPPFQFKVKSGDKQVINTRNVIDSLGVGDYGYLDQEWNSKYSVQDDNNNNKRIWTTIVAVIIITLCICLCMIAAYIKYKRSKTPINKEEIEIKPKAETENNNGYDMSPIDMDQKQTQTQTQTQTNSELEIEVEMETHTV